MGLKTLQKQNAKILQNQMQAIELTAALQKQIERLLNPPRPEFLTTKQCCLMLDRTHATFLRWVEGAGIKAHKIGKTKTYRYADIKALGERMGVTLKPVA